MRWPPYRSGFGVLQDVEQLASLDVEDDVLEPDAALRPELRVLRAVPVEVLHYWRDSTTCAHKAHIGVALSASAMQGPRVSQHDGSADVVSRPPSRMVPKPVLTNL